MSSTNFVTKNGTPLPTFGTGRDFGEDMDK